MDLLTEALVFLVFLAGIFTVLGLFGVAWEWWKGRRK
jgi:hypothetical protein